jgi:acyl-homoserine-lactone acylase
MNLRTLSTAIALTLVTVSLALSGQRAGAVAEALLLQATRTASTAGRATATAGYKARIRRTSFGIPHIEAADLASLGFGEGYAQAEDHLCTIAEQVIEARGQRAKYFGRGPRDGYLNSDIVVKALRVRERAAELHAAQSQEFQDWIVGFAAGYNKYLEETGKGAVPSSCRGQDWVSAITAVDIASVERLRATSIPGLSLDAMIANAQPPTAGPLNVAWWAQSADDAVAASNGWALGRTLTENGRGMLLANPHYPWVGTQRFWEKHLTIPGDLDIYGVAVIGMPGVVIGFNRAVGWTHTISAGAMATVYAVELIAGAPTRYRYGGQERPMTAVPVSVEVLGVLEPLKRTIWFTHYGPVIAPPGLPWTTSRALSIRDANELNGSRLSQWLAMSRAKSMSELQMAHANHQGVASANTIATSADGIAWYTDAAARPSLSPAAITKWLDRRANDPLSRQIELGPRVVLLDGSDPTFEWQDEVDARRPGIIPFRKLPQLEREDYVFNSNNVFWFAHARARIKGEFSPLHGPQGRALSSRTRNNVLHLTNAAPYAAAGQDGKFSLAEVQAAVFANRSLTADLLVPQLVGRCKANPRVTVDAEEVDLSKACIVLDGWDRRFDLESRGAVLFREWLGHYGNQDLGNRGRLFAVAFDPADPIATPRGLAPGALALENLGKAMRVLDSRRIPVEASLGDVQYAFPKLPRRIPIHGGIEPEGVLNQARPRGVGEPAVEGSQRLTETWYPVAGGSSFVMALEYTNDGPRAMAILTYSQSDNPDSQHFADQTELFSKKQWRPILFTGKSIAADTKRDYEVSAARR